MRSRLAVEINYSKCKRSDSVSQITASVWTTFEIFEWSLPVFSQAAQALNLSSRTDLYWLSIGVTWSCKTLYGRTFDLRVKSKYVGLYNRNKDHLPQLSLGCVCTQFGAIGGDLGETLKAIISTWFQNKNPKWLANKRCEQACKWGFKPFICEMRLREYKSTLIDKGLNYLISVKLLMLETILSQRPWSDLVLRSFISKQCVVKWHFRASRFKNFLGERGGGACLQTPIW